MSDLFNEQAERAVVGAMMHGSDLANEAASSVSADDFHFGYCRRLYETIGAIVERGEEPDTVLVADEIERRSGLIHIGGTEVIIDLSSEAIPANLAHHAAIVRDRSRRRRTLDFLNRRIADTIDLSVDVEDTFARIEGFLKDDARSSEGIEFVRYDDLRELPEPGWEALAFIPQGMTVIFGSDGVGKSFLALDLALRMASGGGRMVGGWRVEGGTVAYVAAEGQAGIRDRINGWVEHHNAIPSDIWVHGKPIDMLDPTAVSELSRKIGRIGARLLVIDTYGRCFGTGDENSTADATRFVNSCDRIRNANDCSIIVIHHSGWDDTRIRGNAKLKRDCDAMIQMNEVGGVRELVCHKMKDAERFKSWSVQMVRAGNSVVLEEMMIL